ncbi:MAG: trigger factor [Treponema sp.]|nr:trigger factor [Treponema sp.]
MTVSKELSRLEHSSVKLTLTVNKDDVRAQYDELLGKYGKSIQIPGFRKGKTPRDVLVRKLGDALKGETLGTIIEKALTDTFDDETMPREDRPLPFSTPALEGEPKLDLDSDLSFSVVYDVMPKVAVGKWQGFEVEVPEAAVSDEDLSRELEQIRERNAIVLDRDDDAAAEKDNVVTVDYWEIGEDGEALPNTERKDFVFTLGSKYNVYQFDEEILGMKKGESRDIVKSYPAEDASSPFAGQTKKIRINLTALKEKSLPDLDDELAQDVDEKYETLEDLKNSIRERLGENLSRRLRDITISNLIEKIMAETPVEIPESMIRIETEGRWRNMARRYGITMENIQKAMGKSDEALKEIEAEWRPDIIKTLHSRFIIETLMENQKLEASDEEVEKEIEVLAKAEGAPLEDVKKYYEGENMRDIIRGEIKERKLFDILQAENTVTTGKKGNYLDLMGGNG